jgi:hypothetical protein
LKATFHGVALVLAAVMGAYNAAAWMRRRQSHLAVNATICIAAVLWEQRHVAHHLLPCFRSAAPASVDVNLPAHDRGTQVKAA